ncbi:MAG: cobalamin-dependent protein, partial [Oscillospiraceae bacterium]
MATKEDLLKKLSYCVVEMEDEEVVNIAQEYIDAGYPAIDGILNGLVDGMNKAAKLYEEEEYFIPELLICSDAMYNGLDVLRPHLDVDASSQKCKVAIGVVEGDTHDIGKNLVKIMLEAAGYEIIDLGRDVAPQQFVEAVKLQGARVIAMSTLMSTSTSNMKKVIDILKEE